MPRRRSEPLTEEEKFKLKELQEHDLARLQGQYCLLEKDRDQFACGAKLNQLNKIVAIFKREHRNIETDLEVASAPAKKREDAKDTEQLGKLLDDHDFYDEEVAKQRQNIAEIVEQIRLVEKEVVKLRSQQTTDGQHVERVWAAMKTVEGLENKLDVQNKKFGTICAVNRNLKLEINKKLWERVIFMRIWNKMIDKLVLGKKFMMDLIEQATIAYDQREEWVSKLQALRIKAHHDFIYHTQEMQELKRRQGNSKKLEEFYNTKDQKRIMRDQEQKQKFKRMENKKKMKRKLALYKNYMEDIRQFTAKTDVDAIAKSFCIQEAENFSLFKRVNNLIENLEILNDDLGNLRLEVDNQRLVESDRQALQTTSIANLEAEVENLRAEVNNNEKAIESVEDYINKMLEGIDTLFKICRCDNDPILQLLGNNNSVNINNAMFHLRMVEAALNRALIKIYNYEKIAVERKKLTGERLIKEDPHRQELKSSQILSERNPCPLCVEFELVSDVIDSLQDVLTRPQAKEALRERLDTTDMSVKMHNVSECFLPKSREIIQRRYQ